MSRRRQESPAWSEVVSRVRSDLAGAGLKVTHFDGVVSTANTTVISAGAALARSSGAQVVVGLGGGSSLDTAKAIAVEASHPGSAWDYISSQKAPTATTLPIITVPTTAGSGSQTTPRAMITHATEKAALWNNNLFPKAALIDPDLTLSSPPKLTAICGFESFSRNFEAYVAQAATAYSDMLSLEGLLRIVRWLPLVLAEPRNREGREALAWADAVSGLAISHAGVTLPHNLSMPISGQCPGIANGQALAAIYPEFLRFTYRHAEAKFATVARMLNPTLAGATDAVAAEACCVEMDLFLERIGLAVSLRTLGVDAATVERMATASRSLPYYQYNPRVATFEEMSSLLASSLKR